MATQEIATYLKYANLQMAAEAFLKDGNTIVTDNKYVKALVYGNGHPSRFPTLLAKEFANTWEVVAQQENTPSGFSGTLFREKATGNLVMSFRSTEAIDDTLRDSEGTNRCISSKGWAFGQIADMEDWYKSLIQQGKITASSQFDVTGYSLGGHLAAAFAILRRESNTENVIKHIYTFNGAGTGGLESGVTLTSAMETYLEVMWGGEPSWTSESAGIDMPGGTIGQLLMAKAQANLDAFIQESDRVHGLVASDKPGAKYNDSPVGPLFSDIRYWYAIEVAHYQNTTSAFWENVKFTDAEIETNPDLLFTDKMTEVYGSGITAVATSGLHHSTDRVEIQIEDQPLTRGYPNSDLRIADKWEQNSSGDTHSLVLIIDSLAVMDTISKLDDYVTMDQLQNLLKSATATAASKEIFTGTQGKAEGDTLETIVDALAKIFTGKDSGLRKTTGINDGNTWWTPGWRNAFYGALKNIKTSDGYKNLVGRGGFLS